MKSSIWCRTNLATGTIDCDAVVIAAGVWSASLARMAGDRIPLISERGYHVAIADPKAAPAIPVMPSDGKMANTLMFNGLRCAGQVERASVDAAPDWRRAGILLEHARRSYPALGNGALEVTRWMGHRPSTPDGLPVIGHAARSRDIVYAFGHGHMGLCAGPATGEIAAGLVSGSQTGFDLIAFDPGRFS